MKAALLGLVAGLTAAASPALAEDWHLYSRSQINVFMAEVDGVTQAGGITRILMATVPRTGEQGDYSYTAETYEFQCSRNQWRTAGMVEYGPDGAQADEYPEADAAWEPVRSGTMPEQLMSIACEGARAAPPTWPTVKAFIDAGRG